MIATRQHLEAFTEICTEIILLAPKYQALGFGALGVVQHNFKEGNIEGAFAAGLTSIDYLTHEYERLMDGFVTATADLLGEHPTLDESPADFFGRIYPMGAEGWIELAKKNGVNLQW